MHFGYERMTINGSHSLHHFNVNLRVLRLSINPPVPLDARWPAYVVHSLLYWFEP